MMTLIHLLMLGFLVGAGLCVLHAVARRLTRDQVSQCPRAKIARGVVEAVRLGLVGLGAYFLATLGWATLPAAATGYFLARPALVPAHAKD